MKKKLFTFVGISMTFREKKKNKKIRTTIITPSHQHIWSNNERLCNRILYILYFSFFLYGNNNWRTLFGNLLVVLLLFAADSWVVGKLLASYFLNGCLLNCCWRCSLIWLDDKGDRMWFPLNQIYLL